jgi:hypothetical protein
MKIPAENAAPNAHLSLALGPPVSDFDLGYKFQEQESKRSSVDPGSGSTAWGEPLLVLYVSVARQEGPEILKLSYGLRRSKFS